MTDLEYAAWLADPKAIRVVLFEADVRVAGAVSDSTRFFSNRGYVTSPSDTPANTAYSPIATGGVKITESISLTNEAGLSVGDIEILNPSGIRDSWLDDNWVNRSFKAYFGDVRWARSDFRLIFNGVTADINATTRERIQIKFRDKLQRLNTPVTENKLGGSTPNKDSLRPILLGECHNITPLLSNPVTLEYQAHDGNCESIFEVRDNGKPLSAVTINNATGKVLLGATPAGAITMSVQGDKPTTYANTVGALVQRLATGYGKASDRFITADLDTANLAAFESTHTQPVGLYLPQRTNVLLAIQQLASSIGAQVVMNRKGEMRLFQINFPLAGTGRVVKESDVVFNSLMPVSRTTVIASVKLGYCQNYTVQDPLLTSIPAQHKDLYAKEWLTVTSADATVKSQYKLDEEPEQQDTCLLKGTDAQAEADRRLAIYKQPRTIYKFTGLPSLMNLELGDEIKLYNDRYGFQAGVAALVVSITPDWMTGKIEVEVMV